MSTPKKIVVGFFYTLGSGYVARLASVALTVLICRELDPVFFTDVVLAITLFSLLSSLREFGLPHALLHFQNQVSEFASTHFVLNLLITFSTFLLSLAITAGLALLLPQTFSWTVVFIVWFFSFLNLLRNLVLTSESLLRMEFEFGRLALVHGAGTIIALTSTLLAARAGWGKWSLLLGGWSTYSVFSLVYVVIFSLAVWRSRPLGPAAFSFDREWAGRLLRYGVWIWAGWILQTFVWWYDRLVVKLVIGDIELAFYNHALMLVQIPTAIITHIIFTYTNTLYSRYRGDRARLSELFSRFLGLVWRISSPLALVFVLNSQELMTLMPKWMPAAPILVWLAGYAFLRPLLDDGLGLLWAVGDTRISTKVMGCQALVAAGAVPATAWLWGVKGVAFSLGIITAVGVLGMLISVRRYVSIPWAQVFLRPFVCLLLAATVGVIFHPSLMSSLVVFLLRTGAILAVYGSALWLLERQSITETLAYLRTVLQDKRPAAAQN